MTSIVLTFAAPGIYPMTSTVQVLAASGIYLTLLLLALLPLIVVAALRTHIVARKQHLVTDDLKKLHAFETPLVKSWGGEAGISNEIATYYSRLALLVPATLLSFLYLVCFNLVYAHLLRLMGQAGGLLSSANIAPTLPISMTFLGAYVFNLGLIVRRLWVYDLSDNLFWGCLNRLILSLGLGVGFAVTFYGMKNPNQPGRLSLLFYFLIAFMANKVLLGAIRATTAQLGAVLGIQLLTRVESELQQIAGINVWKEYRLEEEGIEEVENLATADVIELAVNTHYGLRTLIDWIDQAIVITRLPDRVHRMREAGVNVSAIELAWQSKKNQGRPEYAAALARILEIDPAVLAAQMDGMFDDDYVQTLWTLWQTKPEMARAVATSA